MYLANKTQKLAARILDSHLAQDRISHAYIFSGAGTSSGSAEFAAERGGDIREGFAAAFAAALVSGGTRLFGKTDPAFLRRVERHQHPDVRWIGEDREEKSIKIGENSGDAGTVRDVIHWAGLKPYESPRKVCVVIKAERLTDEAANAFLKTLEEPPKHTVFILLVENKTQLLETIQSRCFELRVAATGDDAVGHAAFLDAMPVREIFESYPGLPKPELKGKLDGLMALARTKAEKLLSGGSANARAAHTWLEAFDLVYDSKSAIEANANQKLMATRLAMRLAKLFPSTKATL
jgi:hypothetical protein